MLVQYIPNVFNLSLIIRRSLNNSTKKSVITASESDVCNSTLCVNTFPSVIRATHIRPRKGVVQGGNEQS